MERIVQLSNSDYDRIVEKANLNERHIQEQAQKLYKERGVASIDIKLSHENNEWENSFRFDCSAFVFYKDDRFFIPEELRHRLGKVLKDTMLMEMRKAYGDSEKLFNVLKQKSKSLSAWKWITAVAASSGWITLILYLCLN